MQDTIVIIMKYHNILIINNGLTGGGIERASTTMANCFAKMGHKVTIVALYKNKHFYELHNSVKFIEPDFLRADNNKLFYLFKMVSYVRCQIKLIKPDTILSYGEWTNPFVIFANLGLGYPIYISDRMSPELKLSKYHNLLRRLLYKKANGIIAQTEYSKETIQKKTRAKNITVIPNAVNIIERISIPKENIIVSVGRLAPEKGHKYLIEAFAKLALNDWKLSLIGDGSEKTMLKDLVLKLGISDKVKFYGHLKDFQKHLSEAKIFVMPSLQEGFPNALLEAMSVPLPCISTRYFNGESEIIIDGVNGLLVRPANANELSEAIAKLINNENLRNKFMNEAVKVKDLYSLEKISNRYYEFITSSL